MERFPEIEPFDQGMLEVGDGQLVSWEVCGNPEGRPAVVLHGGPGSGRSAGMRRVFDPDPAVRERAARDWCRWTD